VKVISSLDAAIDAVSAGRFGRRRWSDAWASRSLSPGPTGVNGTRWLARLSPSRASPAPRNYP